MASANILWCKLIGRIVRKVHKTVCIFMNYALAAILVVSFVCDLYNIADFLWAETIETWGNGTRWYFINTFDSLEGAVFAVASFSCLE